MRAHWLTSALLLMLLGCGGKQPEKAPATQAATTSTTTPPKKTTAPPTTKTAEAAPASTSMASTAPASLATIIPRLEAPTTPAPELEMIEYETWFSLEHFPAISADGLVLATFSAEGYDEREGTGDTVSLVFYNVDDHKVKQRFDLLLPAETYAESEAALKKQRAALLKTVKPRVEAAQQALAAVTWLPLEELASIDEGSWGREADPKALKLEFNAETIQAIASVGGRVVSDKTYPALKAPSAKPCKDEDFEPGCGCEYPLRVEGVLYNAELRIFLLSLEHMIDHQCEEPPPDPTLAIRYE